MILDRFMSPYSLKQSFVFESRGGEEMRFVATGPTGTGESWLRTWKANRRFCEPREQRAPGRRISSNTTARSLAGSSKRFFEEASRDGFVFRQTAV